MILGSCLHSEVLFKTISQNRAEFGLRIPKDLAYFEGHFPDMPIVPGVVLLHWAVEFAKDIFKIPGSVSGASQIKFSNLMRPLDEPCLTLDHLSEKFLIMYHYKENEKIYASGRFVYSLCSEGKNTNDL